MAWLTDPQIWASFLTLTALEIVLGIDNIVFLSVASNTLPAERRAAARRIGLALAFVMRVILLSFAVWLTGLTKPIVALAGLTLSWRDLLLLSGGLFLLIKGTREIHDEVEGEPEAPPSGQAGAPAAFAAVVVQITVLDAVFSLDSVITAVGMTRHLGVMVAAITVAILVMLFAAGAVGAFIARHPTTRMLALSFLLLVGVALIADGLHFHVPRGYLYFAIGFSLVVEVLNIQAARRRRRRRTGERP